MQHDHGAGDTTKENEGTLEVWQMEGKRDEEEGQDVIDELQRALREDMQLCDQECMAELRTYVRDEKGKMGGSPFDDRVMSLAIANYMLRFVFMHEFQPERQVTPGSWGDWEQRTYGETFHDLLESGRKYGSRQSSIGNFAIRSK